MLPRIAIISLTVCCIVLGELRAQDATPPTRAQPPLTPNPHGDIFEASLGFDYLHVPDAFVQNMYGFDLSVFVNATPWLALGGEFVAAFGTQTRTYNYFFFRRNVDFDESRIAYLFGPRVKIWRGKNFNAFLEALGGGAHAYVESTDFGYRRTAAADGFAAAVGGGADWQFARHWRWRLLEANYLPVHFSSGWQDHWRFGSSISYSFGTGW